MKEKAYYEKVNVKNETLLRNLLQKMPPYCKQFFIGIEPTTSSRTRIAYAYDLNCFFDYLHENNPLCTKKDITEIPLSVLGNLAPMDIEEYLSYLKYYEKDGVEHTNDERGLKRKLASLRSFYRYLYKNEMIGQDPAVKVDMPKIHEKTITRLDIDEVANLLDEVESGESLTEKQQKFHEKTPPDQAIQGNGQHPCREDQPRGREPSISQIMYHQKRHCTINGRCCRVRRQLRRRPDPAAVSWIHGCSPFVSCRRKI